MRPTRDHEVIRQWAARHGAAPAEIRPLTFDSEPTLLHFLFGEARKGTPELRPITWEDFFARFDLMDLALAIDESSSRFDIVRIEQGSHGLAH